MLNKEKLYPIHLLYWCMLGVVLAVKPKRKRSRILIILALPALALLWLVGWTLYWIGCKSDNKSQVQSKHKHKSKENITLIAAPTLEEMPKPREKR